MPPEPRDMSRYGKGYRARTAARSGRPPRVAAEAEEMETTAAGATIAVAAPLVAAVAGADVAIAAATVAAMVPAEAVATVALPPAVGGTSSGLAETLLRVRSRAQETGAKSASPVATTISPRSMRQAPLDDSCAEEVGLPRWGDRVMLKNCYRSPRSGSYCSHGSSSSDSGKRKGQPQIPPLQKNNRSGFCCCEGSTVAGCR